MASVSGRVKMRDLVVHKGVDENNRRTLGCYVDSGGRFRGHDAGRCVVQRESCVKQ